MNVKPEFSCHAWVVWGGFGGGLGGGLGVVWRWFGGGLGGVWGWFGGGLGGGGFEGGLRVV